MPDLIPANLTPQEQAEFDKASPPPPQQTSVLQGLSAPELAELAVKDKDNFDLVHEFRQNQDLWKDPAVVQKVADAHNLLRQRGFKFADLPGPAKIAGQVKDVALGMGKQAWNYASGAVNSLMGAAVGGDIENELTKDTQQRVAENFSGTEQAVTGLANMAEKGVRKVFGKNPADLTPEEKLSDLWSAVGKGENEQDISKGHGAFMQAVGGNVISDLEKSGQGVRPEEVAKLAPGDPFSFWAFGKGMEAAGAGVKAVTPSAVSSAIKTGADFVHKNAAPAVGKAIEAAGDLTQLVAKKSSSGGKVVLPIAGAIVGGVKGGPVGILPGIAGGQLAAKTVATAAKGAESLGGKVASFGEQVSGAKPLVSPYAQLTKDLAESAPHVIGSTLKGVATDVGLAAVTAENPHDTEGVGLGAAIGALHGAGGAFKHAISGQIIAPRAYGNSSPVSSSGAFPALDAMHTAAVQSAPPGVTTRLNAVREFLKSAAPGTDVFLAPDDASLKSALEQTGMTPEQAQSWADQDGFFTANLPGKDGQPRRVIVAKNIEAAPHEAFHAIQDVLGESANRQIDELVKKEYAGQWDYEGQKYAKRLDPSNTSDWRDVILDHSGWGRSDAVEKLMQQAQEANPNADTDTLKQQVNSDWDARLSAALKNNPNASMDELQSKVWRDVLTPEEAKATADRYIARELAAENFDMVFKHGPEGKSVPEQFARIVAKLTNLLGGDALSDRRSDIGGLNPKLPVVEAVRKAVPQTALESIPVKPEVVAPKSKGPGPKPKVVPPGTPAPDEAKEIADAAPAEVPPGKTASPKELLGTVAEAIAQQGGVKINYHSAPGEPAAATSSNRDVRREVIEAFRDMPKSARALWEKNFFPDKIIKTKSGEYQVQGWAPEVFAANAHKLANVLGEVDPKLSPYEIDPNFNTFTEAGWRALYEDAQTFVKNQMAGRTGSGEELVVPKALTEKGVYAPQVKSGSRGLDQTKADFINMLFNFRLPETPRVQKGKLPLNIVGQEVSEATKPGRTEIPVRPRGEFTGAAADELGIAGRHIEEVNPLRQEIERAAQAAGKAMPSMVEVIQKLNLSNINDVTHAPEQPQFRGNTLTLSAGFQPASAEARKSGKEFIDKAAIRLNDGKLFTGVAHFDAVDQAVNKGLLSYDDENLGDKYKNGFLTSKGRFVDREEASKIAQAVNQLPENSESVQTRPKSLEAHLFNSERQFQPPKLKDTDVPLNPEDAHFGNFWVSPEGKFFAASDHREWAAERLTGVKPIDAEDSLKDSGWARISRERETSHDAAFIDGRGLSEKQKSAIAVWSNEHSGAEIIDLSRSGLGRGPQFQPGSIKEAMDSMKDPEAWKKIIAHPPGKFGGGLTGWAYEQGAKARTPEDLAAFKSANEVFSALSKQAMANKDFNLAMDYMGRAQAAHEAYQAATGVNFNGEAQGVPFIQKHYDASYKAPMPVENSQAQTIDNAPGTSHNSPMIKTDIRGQSQPKANEEIHSLAEEYARDKGFDYSPSRNSVPVNETLAKKLADHYEAEKSNPSDKKVQESYKALASETLDQYRAIVNAGYEIEPWTGKGEPYKDSTSMTEDIANNRHLFYLPTKEAGTLDKANPMMADSGIDGAPVNDIFRAVHDFFGHAKEGFQFGPRGEFNAWRAHSEMYSPEAQGALAAETLAQNFWVNYGKHLRTESGNVPVKGEKGFVLPSARPFAEQKNVVIPQNFIDEAKGVSGQAQPKSLYETDDLGKPVPLSFRKGWLAPSGKFYELGEHPTHEEFAREATHALAHASQELYKDGWVRVTPYGSDKLMANTEAGKTLSRKQERVLSDWAASDEDGRAVVFDNGHAYKNIGGQAQAQPAKAKEEDFKLLRGGPDGFSKSWILPDGKPVQLGGQYHSHWLAEDPEGIAAAKKYGIKVPEFDGNDTENVREDALKKGFVRLNYSRNTGTLVVEARAKDWPNQVDAVRQFAEANLSDLDNIKIALLDPKVERVVNSNDVKLFEHDDADKIEKVPLLNESAPTSRKELPVGAGETLRPDKSYNPNDNYFKTQAQPKNDYEAEPEKPFAPIPWAAKNQRSLFDGKDMVGAHWLFRDGSALNVEEAQYHDDAATQIHEIPSPDKGTPSEAFQYDTGSIRVAVGGLGNPKQVLDYGNGELAISLSKKPSGAQLKALTENLKQTTIYHGETIPHYSKVAVDIHDSTGEVVAGKIFDWPTEQGKFARFIRNPFEGQAQPKRAKDEALALPGMEFNEFKPKEIADMTKDELAAHFPESVVPRTAKDLIDSNIVGSPLYKKAGSEEKAVDAFAQKMVKFAKESEANPVYNLGKKWYSEFAPLLKKEFGDDAPLMAELLAATSPQTSVETNFGYAFDALQGIKSGRFDKTIAKFKQGLSMLENDAWLGWYNKELKAGNIPDAPAAPTPAAFLAAFIDKHDLKPTQSNGKLFGQHSLAVLKVFARRWMDLNAGPKTRNFVANLLGDGHEATIDLWADRTMRRLGYADDKERWRILPKNQAGVSDEDFNFAQKVFRKAADELKMNPDDLQGALWFAEKQLWSDRGWGRLDLGDFRKEMEKIPLLKHGYQHRLAATQAADKVKSAEQIEIQPRAIR